MKYERELKFGTLAAVQAGEFLLSNYQDLRINNFKGNPKDFVTNLDIEADRIIKYILKTEYPDDIFLTEESVSEFEFNPDKRVWIIDPIDGTRNFSNQFNYFSISIALWEKGQIVLGIVHAPKLSDTYCAIKDEGAFLNSKKLETVMKDNDLLSSIVITGFAYFDDERVDSSVIQLKNVIRNTTDVLMLGSAALDTCNVAFGAAGTYFEKDVKIWDIAAGSLIVKESGGIVSNFKGEPISLENPEIFEVSEFLASKNMSIHSKMLEILND